MIIIKLFILQSAFVVIMAYQGRELFKKPEYICDDPTIDTADRLTNGTVRIYKGSYYWELNGLFRDGTDGHTGSLVGPIHITSMGLRNFLPIKPNTCLVTMLGGDNVGDLYRFDGNEYFVWAPNGTQIGGYAGGQDWKEFHDNIPFDAVFHYAHPDWEKNRSMAVVFEGENIVRYFKTNSHPWTPNDTQSSYAGQGYVGGKNEKYPSGVDAAFSWFPERLGSSVENVFIYLFVKDKYCKRRISDDTACSIWYFNKDLFGCYRNSSTIPNAMPSFPAPRPPIPTTIKTTLPSHSSFIIPNFRLNFIWIFISVLYIIFNC